MHTIDKVDSIDRDEKTYADKGYRDPAFILPDTNNSQKHKLNMSRNETINTKEFDTSMFSKPPSHTILPITPKFFTPSAI